MRWNTRPPAEHQPYKRWFAWYPTYMGNGDWAWMEVIERRIHYPHTDTKYGKFYVYRYIGEQR
jgi:hypothetical protein